METIEKLEEDPKMKRHIELLRKGLSPCCEAEFNTSRVIKAGRFKNHGPRYCSKCRALCFMV